MRAMLHMVAIGLLPGCVGGDESNPDWLAVDLFGGGKDVSSDWSCGVRQDRDVECWGRLGSSDPSTTDAVALATGSDGFCALTANGSLRCRGRWSRSIDSSEGGRFLAVAAGSDVRCAIFSDGRGRGGELQCWGDSFHGADMPPPGRFVAVDLAVNRGCGIDVDGAIQCWGRTEPEMGTPPEGSWVDLAVADWHACALSARDEWHCWGWPDMYEGFVPGRYLDLSVSRGRTCVVQSDGTLECLGARWSDKDWEFFEPLPDGDALRTVSLALLHGCGLTQDGAVICWGTDYYDEASPPD